MNSSAFLLYGVQTSKFQGWIYTPAVFQIGIFELSTLILSVLALFKGKQFKSAVMFFFAIYTLFESIDMLTDQISDKPVVALAIVGLITSAVLFIFYKLLNKNLK